MPTKQKGFTLVEIIIVVTIVVILGLATLVGINPMAQIFKGFDTRRKADLNKIKIALEAYYSDHECYPNFLPVKDAEGRPSYICDSAVLSPYLASMPCDPNSKKPYTLYLTPKDSICPQDFAFYAKISSPSDDQANDITLCPNTIAFHSPEMNKDSISYGCTFGQKIYYGCKEKACVPVGTDGMPIETICSPRYYEDQSCGGPFLNCATQDECK